MERALRSLPERYATVVALRYFEGLPPRRIAAAIDLPLETVYARLRRGLRQLRHSLDGWLSNDARPRAVSAGPAHRA